MKDSFFTGTCTAMVTPFLNGKVNYPMAQMLIRRQIDAGIPAVVLAGTTGESATLTDDEKIELFRRCKTYAGNSCKIIAGTGSNSTEHAVHLSQEAEAAGADALLIVSPYYNKSTPEGLYAHYITIAHAVKIPIILYNVPGRTGLDIPVTVYERLSRIPNIIGVKEASSDITKIARIRNLCDPSFSIWSGNDDQIVPVMAMGGSGVISVVSNLFPEEVNGICNAALDGDYEKASHLQCRMQPLIELMFCEVNPIPVKEAMKIIGFDCGNCRLPLSRLSQENRAKLVKYFS